jgi:hypothetical protein
MRYVLIGLLAFLNTDAIVGAAFSFAALRCRAFTVNVASRTVDRTYDNGALVREVIDGVQTFPRP